MFASLKAQATSAATAAASAAQAGAKAAYDGAKERVETAQAGKKMLDEGGEEIKLKLLAKKASTDVVAFDANLVTQLALAIPKYQETVVKMQAAAALPSSEADFGRLATVYEARALEIQTGLSKLKVCARVANISPAEKDAIAILSTKLGLSGMHETVRGSVTNRTSISSASDSTGYSNVQPPAAPDASEGAQKSFLEKAQDKVKAATDQAKQRYDTVNAGKKIVDEGGEEAITKLMAKKASTDVIVFDKKVMDLLKKGIELCGDAESKMKAGLPHASGESPAFDELALDFGARKQELETLSGGLSPVPEATSVSAEEKDAILYASAHLGVKSVGKTVTDAAGGVQAACAERRVSGSASAGDAGDAAKVESY
jgi:hypothetical protein